MPKMTVTAVYTMTNNKKQRTMNCQKQSQTNPIQTQNKPNQTQFKAQSNPIKANLARLWRFQKPYHCWTTARQAMSSFVISSNNNKPDPNVSGPGFVCLSNS